MNTLPPNLSTWLLAASAVIATALLVPYGATAIAYRRRDNGLAYLLLVLGVGVWNSMFAAQLLSPKPLIKVFFLALSVVGALLTGLGWFLFASTASRTSRVLDRRLVYGTVAVLVGLDIIFAVTGPVHPFYWVVPATGHSAGFAVILPKLGYWLHTELLIVLFGAGTLLFAAAWQAGSNIRYNRAYTIAGTATVIAVIGSNGLAPGGFSLAPLTAVSLTTIGWLQAKRGAVFSSLCTYLRTRRT